MQNFGHPGLVSKQSLSQSPQGVLQTAQEKIPAKLYMLTYYAAVSINAPYAVAATSQAELPKIPPVALYALNS